MLLLLLLLLLYLDTLCAAMPQKFRSALLSEGAEEIAKHNLHNSRANAENFREQMSILFSFLITGCLSIVNGCSNILVTPKASKTGVAMLGDNDDASKRFGMVTYVRIHTHISSIKSQLLIIHILTHYNSYTDINLEQQAFPGTDSRWKRSKRSF